MRFADPGRCPGLACCCPFGAKRDHSRLANAVYPSRVGAVRTSCRYSHQLIGCEGQLRHASLGTKTVSDLDKELKVVRADLDELDKRLVLLINDRARLVQRIGKAKAQAGLRVYVPDRERQVLDRIRKLNPGPLELAPFPECSMSTLG